MLARRRLVVRGIVQGIGFRPFVYGLAGRHSLTGLVRNRGGDVEIEAQGPPRSVEEFDVDLVRGIPAPGRIDGVERFEIEPVPDEREFAIAESPADAEPDGWALAPDRWVCPDCLREMRDPADRRYRYPFVNCTACGPRFTIARSLPYDRPRTTMAAFEMCDECAREYRDPADRRYHAQPVACPACGPTVWLARGGAPDADPPADRSGAGEAIAEAIRELESGSVVAVKGIGGFHLAADARNDGAVRRLRELKGRPRKPLAVMARDLETARRLAVLNSDAEELIASPAAPIALAPARPDSGLAPGIAPHLSDVGVLLPYSPLHHLLLDGPLDALVMTSGNHPSEPIVVDNAEALERLPADAHLLHDREICAANDDSVARTSPGGPIFVRRSRGYVPEPIPAAHLPRREILALGAELRAAVSVLSRGEMVVGRHLGDLDNSRAEAAFCEEVERMLRFGRVDPEAVAVDLHPDFFSTIHAEERFGDLRIVRVQHHHAHLAAVLFEHGLGPDAEAAGIVLDGIGYGEGGGIWGGEVLLGGYAAFCRVAHLREIPQPGGDRAAREPGRMATSLLLEVGRSGAEGVDEAVAEICRVRAVSPLTSSAGRLLDGAAALLGVAPAVQDYEGEAAARLEAASDPSCGDAYPLPLEGGVLDTRALVEALLDDPAPREVRAARLHNGLADGLARAAIDQGAPLVALGGGCMVNRLLVARIEARLGEAGVRSIRARRLPPGDGGISAGQAACAACRIGAGE